MYRLARRLRNLAHAKKRRLERFALRLFSRARGRCWQPLQAGLWTVRAPAGETPTHHTAPPAGPWAAAPLWLPLQAPPHGGAAGRIDLLIHVTPCDSLLASPTHLQTPRDLWGKRLLTPYRALFPLGIPLVQSLSWVDVSFPFIIFRRVKDILVDTEMPKSRRAPPWFALSLPHRAAQVDPLSPCRLPGFLCLVWQRWHWAAPCLGRAVGLHIGEPHTQDF